MIFFQKGTSLSSLVLSVLIILLISGTSVLAAYEKVSPGANITIGEFVYDDNYSPTTTPCTITINDPLGSVQVNDASMTSLANGWHYYEFSVSPSAEMGIWPTFMSCGSALNGDLVKADKSFVVEQVLSTTTIWAAEERTLTDYSTSTLASSIWNASGRSLTTFGSLASDVWSDVYAPTRRLTSGILSGGGSLVTIDDLGVATSGIISEVLTNRTAINNLNDISASDVWAYSTRDLTDYATSTITDAVWNRASAQLTTAGSIGKLLVDNIDAQISSRGTSSLTAAEVWAVTERTLTDYSTSTIAQAVWQNTTRSLTEGLITAQEVWDVLVSGLTTVDSVGKLVADSLDAEVSSRASLENQIAGWNVSLSDFSSVQTGETYRAKLVVLNATSSPQNPYSTPDVTLYDADRNIVVSSVPMTNLSTGVYEYTYSVPSAGSQGV